VLYRVVSCRVVSCRVVSCRVVFAPGLLRVCDQARIQLCVILINEGTRCQITDTSFAVTTTVTLPTPILHARVDSDSDSGFTMPITRRGNVETSAETETRISHYQSTIRAIFGWIYYYFDDNHCLAFGYTLL
jgi:hypothetical protein